MLTFSNDDLMTMVDNLQNEGFVVLDAAKQKAYNEQVASIKSAMVEVVAENEALKKQLESTTKKPTIKEKWNNLSTGKKVAIVGGSVAGVAGITLGTIAIASHAARANDACDNLSTFV